MAGVRIDDVVVAHPALLEESLVIARGRDRRVDQWNPGDHFSVALSRIPDSDHPGLAESIPDDAAVAAGGHVGAGETARLQYLDASIHRVALGDPAQVDAHPLLRESHRPALRIEQDVAKVDRRQRLADLRIVRTDVFAEVIQVADAGVSNVERAVGDHRVLFGGGQQIEELLADPHGTVRGLGIDQGDLAGGFVRAHRVIDVSHFLEHSVDRRVSLRLVVTPYYAGATRTHDGIRDAP